MKLSARLLIFLIICTLSPQAIKAEDANNSNTGQDSAVAIELTKFDVNDTTLELSYKIKNNTDHNVWICDSVDIVHSNTEIYLAEDAQTLVIRKRLDVSPEVVWAALPAGRYVRLQPAQEYSESLSCAVPVRPVLTYINERAYAESAKRIVLEIGFYDQDLPGLIRSIIEVAERLGCANVEYEDYESDIMRHYFRGLLIKGRFGGLEHFDESNPDGSEQFRTCFTDQLLGEQVLQISIDDLCIPYKGNEPPLENQEVNEPSESQDVEESAVSMELTHFEITDANLELGWNIKNNTDHDVWICNSLSQDPSFSVFENFMNTDNKTLIISRRFALPMQEGRLMNYPPLRSRYKLLSAGQERQESISLIVPVAPYLVSSRESGNAEYAERLSVEIGFYDEDLPGLILKTVELAEHYNCNLEVGVPDPNDPEYLEICYRFFVGRNIAQFFKYSLGWSYSVTSGEDDIWMPYVGLNTGEKALHLTVEGISIPYKSDYPPLTSE